MISNYGGGVSITAQDYLDADPRHHPNQKDSIDPDSEISRSIVNSPPPPDWDKKAERARWVVGHSLWTTSTCIQSDNFIKRE